MPKKKKQALGKKERKGLAPSLKGASGAGFSFEDKVTAFLFCEMLLGKPSLGPNCGPSERIERQANDWEPFGDLLISAAKVAGESLRCGCSVKSNRQFNSNGCNDELRDGLWSLVAKPIFNQQADALGIFCSELSNDVSPVLNQLCRQAREEDRPERLDEKVKDVKHRKIYESFRHKTDLAASGLPWHILKRLVPREFDFEKLASRYEHEAIGHCSQVLHPSDTDGDKAADLWKELLEIARQLRDVGGSVTRESLIRKLRHQFRLGESALDATAWHHIRLFSQEWMEQIESTLPTGLELPRAEIANELKNTLSANRACLLLGESGSGKSALVKTMANKMAANSRTQIVWIKSDQFNSVLAKVPDFDHVLLRTSFPRGLLILDGLEACYSANEVRRIGRTIASIIKDSDSDWKVVLVCQSAEWTRLSRVLIEVNQGNAPIFQSVYCKELSPEDRDLVFDSSPAIRRLRLEPKLNRLLSSPKILSLLLRSQLAENIPIVNEADLIDWWWGDHVKQGRQFTEEEKIARKVAVKMAQDLTTELSPDEVEGPAAAFESLSKNRILIRTRDGRLRFHHDLLADWSRVMHLRLLGDGVLPFMLSIVENPPWLRAVRLFSQHLLERNSDLDRWRSLLGRFGQKGKGHNEAPARDLLLLDVWLEGIPYCSDGSKVLKSLQKELFDQNGWLLQRLIQRLLQTGTIPDPIIQAQCKEIDIHSADIAAAHFRWPLINLWNPLIDFLTSNAKEVTDIIPVELAEIGLMWGQMAQHLNLQWSAFAEVMLMNGEKELKREVAGEYRRSERGRLADRNRPRINIYAAALLAGSQFPDRAAKFALKAAGRAPWDKGDVASTADGEWLGEYQDSIFSSHDTYVMHPIESWADGPIRQVSKDFFHAWFDATASLPLFRSRPEAARETTLALLIEWPKRGIKRGSPGDRTDRHGFTFNADQLQPVFWSKGPFLNFLRLNWKVGLDVVIRLVNFATDRYEEWWPSDPAVSTLTFSTPFGEVAWNGNHQVYAWNRYHMNTPKVVTCALMALEKWLDDQIAAQAQITQAVQMIYQNGKSLAFAGVLVSIGKRHPEQFMQLLRPLLFYGEIYMNDYQAVSQTVGGVYWPQHGHFLHKLYREWENLPGRKTCLKNACCRWLLTNPAFKRLMLEVAETWRTMATALGTDSKERWRLLRWASMFDNSHWKETTLGDGQIHWEHKMPEELRDSEVDEILPRRQELLIYAHKCAEILEKRPQLSDDEVSEIWNKLSDWVAYERLTQYEVENLEEGEAVDHRHARAGLLAVVLCLGASWLNENPDRRKAAHDEVRKLFDDAPVTSAYTAEDTHNDCEGFLARAAIRCWACEPSHAEWREIVSSFVTAYRYNTIRHLFEEAFHLRGELNGGYEALEAFALSFAVVRTKATRSFFLGTRREVNDSIIKEWFDEWIPNFAEGNGPAWNPDWSLVENIMPFPPKRDNSYGLQPMRHELYRRGYGIDVGMLIAVFGHLPPLSGARTDAEQTRWFEIAEQMIRMFCRTLPQEQAAEHDEWHFDHWTYDEKIFAIAAARLFQCTADQRPRLWRPILDLPPLAHYHITSFLHCIWIEFLRIDPLDVSRFIPIWREMADYLARSNKWMKQRTHDTVEIWRTVLLYDRMSSGDEVFQPLVQSLHDLYEQHVKRMGRDAREQSSFAAFLTTKAGRSLLVDALSWFGNSWVEADRYFWDTIVEYGTWAQLLEIAWREQLVPIRGNPDAFAAFKTLTLNLAAHHVHVALQIQDQLGTAVTI